MGPPAAPEPLSDAAEEALRVWDAMGGWYPERLPALILLLEVVHLDGLMSRLLAIRKGLQESHG